MLMGKEATVERFISNYRHDPITIDKCYLKDIEETNSRKLIIPGQDIFSKYKADLDEIIEIHTMSSIEKRRWLYNPKVMSFDLYNTTEYWFLLLQANEVFSATQFSMNPVKKYNSSLPMIISRIINLEKEIIDENEDMISKNCLK